MPRREFCRRWEPRFDFCQSQRHSLHDRFVASIARQSHPSTFASLWRLPACCESMNQNSSKHEPFQTTRSEEHTSELQSLMRISYAVFCLKKKNNNKSALTNIHLTPDVTTLSIHRLNIMHHTSKA